MTATVIRPRGMVLPRRPDLPGWPVLALLWGFPAWWALGLLPFVPIIFGLIMGALLISGHRSVRLVPGVLPLVLFAAWVIPCAVALDTALRGVGYLMRAGTLFAAAVALVYVVNARRSLTVGGLLGGLCVIWSTVIAGGYLGMVLPYGHLTTPVGLLMPEGLLQNPLVHDLVFPPFAQVQTPWGAPEPFIRPSAPFPYSNGWGSGISLLTPVAIATAIRSRRTGLRFAILLGLVASVVPAAATLNRGMLLILIVSVSYVGLTLAMRGRLISLLGVIVGIAVVVVALVQLGVIEGILGRQSYSDTTSGRASIYLATFAAALRSPILGFGAPRPNEDIGIDLGTQGAVWMFLFSYGFVGVGLFLAFLVGVMVRTRVLTRDLTRLWLHSSVLGACVGSFFYGFDIAQWLIVVTLSGLLLRERYRDPMDRASPVGPNASASARGPAGLSP